MDATTTPVTAPAPGPGLLGTSMPSSVTAIAALILFFLPFAELRCTKAGGNDWGGMVMSGGGVAFTNTGFGLATGGQWKTNLGPFQDKDDTKGKDQGPNSFALIALGLAAASVAFTFIKKKGTILLVLVTAAGSLIALAGLFFDLRSKVNKVPRGVSDDLGNQSMFNVDKYKDIGLELAFTPWFYACAIMLLTTAWLSYKRYKLSESQPG